MAYATSSESDVFALSRGETDFITSDDKGGSALANGAVSAVATVINLDGLTTPSLIAVYDLLQFGNELLQVTAITYGTPTDATVNVTRGYNSTTAAIIADNQSCNIKNLAKIRLLEIATQDIINYHRQVLFSSNWFQGNAILRDACSAQAIYLLKNLEARELADFIKGITSSEYADTVLSVKGMSPYQLAPELRTKIDYLLQQVGISQGEYQRA